LGYYAFIYEHGATTFNQKPLVDKTYDISTKYGTNWLVTIDYTIPNTGSNLSTRRSYDYTEPTKSITTHWFTNGNEE
jgi:hypothetical protein